MKGLNRLNNASMIISFRYQGPVCANRAFVLSKEMALLYLVLLLLRPCFARWVVRRLGLELYMYVD
jgi:hypothetical protein